MEEIDRGLAVLMHDRKNTGLLNHIVRLQMSIGRYKDAIRGMEGFKGERDSDFTSNYGYAICRHHREHPNSEKYQEGMAMLGEVAEGKQPHVEALTRRAELTHDSSPRVLRERWQAAFEADPSDPRALTGYLRTEIAHTGNLSLVPLLRPSMEEAIRRSEDQVVVRVNLPRALYHIAELQLLLGAPLHSLCSLCRALCLTSNTLLVDDMVRATGMLATVREQLEGFEWFERVLQLFLSLGSKALHPRLKKLVHVPVKVAVGERPVNLDRSRPVVLVAGGVRFDGVPQLRGTPADPRGGLSGILRDGHLRWHQGGNLRADCGPL